MSNIGKRMPTSYGEADKLIGDDKRERTIANNTMLVRLGMGDGNAEAIGLVHHQTRIVTFYDNGMVRLDCNGYRSATTKDRLNGVLRFSSYRVFQKAFTWYVSRVKTVDGQRFESTYDYDDGMTIDLLD